MAYDRCGPHGPTAVFLSGVPASWFIFTMHAPERFFLWFLGLCHRSSVLVLATPQNSTGVFSRGCFLTHSFWWDLLTLGSTLALCSPEQQSPNIPKDQPLSPSQPPKLLNFTIVCHFPQKCSKNWLCGYYHICDIPLGGQQMSDKQLGHSLTWWHILSPFSYAWLRLCPTLGLFAIITNQYKLSGLRWHKFISLQFWGSEAHSVSPWAKIKVLAGHCSF